MNTILILVTLVTFSANSADSFRIIASQCTLQLQIVESFSVGKIEPQILRCFCDCDAQTVIRSLWQAAEHFKPYCDSQQSSNTGQCLEKFQSNILVENCPGPGYADCWINFKAREIVHLKVLKLKKVSKCFIADSQDRLEMGITDRHVQYENRTFEINGAECEIPPGLYFLYVSNEQDPKDEVLKSFQFTVDNIKLLRKRSFVTTMNKDFQEYQLSRITLKHEICTSEDNTAFDFTPELPYHTGDRIWSKLITKFEIINNDTMVIYYYSKLSETQVRDVSKTSTTMAPNTAQQTSPVTTVAPTTTQQTSSVTTTRITSAKSSNPSVPAVDDLLSHQNEIQYLKWVLSIILTTCLPIIFILGLSTFYLLTVRTQ